MKIRERHIVITTLIIVIFCAGYWIWWQNRAIEFYVEEIFSDSTFTGKINFCFVSVNLYDLKEMDKFGKDFLSNHLTVDMLRRDLKIVSVVHFYKKDDTSNLNTAMEKKIKKMYPHLKDIQNNLQCVRGGYIYTGFSRKMQGYNVPKDTIFKTTVILPKNGIKAKDIMKVTRKKNVRDNINIFKKDPLKVK